MEMPARNARRNLTDVDGSADLVRITTTRIAHVFCLLYENETDFPSQPRLPFRRARTARGVIALDLEANRDASYETNGGVILWRVEGFRPVITSSAPCLVSPVVPLGQVAGRDGGHSALPAQSDERGSASRWTPPCSRMTAEPRQRCTNKIVSSRLRFRLPDSDSRFRFALCKCHSPYRSRLSPARFPVVG